MAEEVNWALRSGLLGAGLWALAGEESIEEFFHVSEA